MSSKWYSRAVHRVVARQCTAWHCHTFKNWKNMRKKQEKSMEKSDRRRRERGDACDLPMPWHELRGLRLAMTRRDGC